MEVNGRATTQDSSAPMNTDELTCSICGSPIGSGEGRYNLPDCVCCVDCYHSSASLLT
jgi:hypothetical protein